MAAIFVSRLTIDMKTPIQNNPPVKKKKKKKKKRRRKELCQDVEYFFPVKFRQIPLTVIADLLSLTI